MISDKLRYENERYLVNLAINARLTKGVLQDAYSFLVHLPKYEVCALAAELNILDSIARKSPLHISKRYSEPCLLLKDKLACYRIMAAVCLLRSLKRAERGEEFR
jgi:hypothetical protein